MKTNCIVLERKSGSISNPVFEGTIEEVKNWMSENTALLAKRGSFMNVSEFDAQTRDEYDLGFNIYFIKDIKAQKQQIVENGGLSTYTFVNNN
jgi:hypothetical protein